MPIRSWRYYCLAAPLVAMALWAWPSPAVQADEQTKAPFTLTEGDRVVLLGSTFTERDQAHGYLEAALSAHFHHHNIQFRNLGWSGDNVFGEARAGFGTVADGFEQLKQHVLALRPTAIFLSYGANESFAGQAGLESFLAGLDVLLKMLDETQAQIVFFSPTPHEALAAPLPDPTEHNQQLKLYSDAIAAVAAKRQAPFVNLFSVLGSTLQPPAGAPLTDNGLHLTAYGYWRAALAIDQALGISAPRWIIEIDAPNRNIFANGTTVSRAKFSPTGLSFEAEDGELPFPPPPSLAPPQSAAAVPTRIIRVKGLPSGTYALKIGGEKIGASSAQQWAAGLPITRGPDFGQAEQLRQTIVAKNRLYFYRWRPQNETYLFGFRKHEQGQNAVEIPQFDPLVAAQEASIHSLSAPVAHEWQIIKLDSK